MESVQSLEKETACPASAFGGIRNLVCEAGWDSDFNVESFGVRDSGSSICQADRSGARSCTYGWGDDAGAGNGSDGGKYGNDQSI